MTHLHEDKAGWQDDEDPFEFEQGNESPLIRRNTEQSNMGILGGLANLKKLMSQKEKSVKMDAAAKKRERAWRGRFINLGNYSSA